VKSFLAVIVEIYINPKFLLPYLLCESAVCLFFSLHTIPLIGQNHNCGCVVVVAAVAVAVDVPGSDSIDVNE